MTDRPRIQSGWQKMKAGNVLSKYMAQNPGEVAKIDAYVAAIAAGQNPLEPQLATLFGDGFTDVVAAAITPDPVPATKPLSATSAGRAGVLATINVTTPQPAPTPAIDDIAVFALGISPTYLTHLDDKYGIVERGGYYTPIAGKAIKYTSGTQAYDDDWWQWSPTGARAAYCRTNGWLLHDNTGHELIYGGNPLIDMGDPAFQADWLTRTQAFLTAHPVLAGIKCDNFHRQLLAFGNFTYPVCNQAGAIIWTGDTGTSSSFAAALLSFAKNCLLPLKQAGYLVVVNGGLAADSNFSLSQSWADQFAPYVTGFTKEYWNQTGDGTNAMGDVSHNRYFDFWNEGIAYLEHCQNVLGLDVYPNAYTNGTTQLAVPMYLRCSQLMVWNGGNGASYHAPSAGVDIWDASWTFDPGKPTGPKVAVGACWKRPYENGTPYVNPTPTSQSPDGRPMAARTGLWVAN